MARDTYRYDQIKRVALDGGEFRLKVHGDSSESKWLSVTNTELFAIALMLSRNDNAGAEPADPDVAHPFPVVEVTHRHNPAMTRLPITSGEHIKRLAEMAAAYGVMPDAMREWLPRAAAWWSYCAGETDERPS